MAILYLSNYHSDFMKISWLPTANFQYCLPMYIFPFAITLVYDIICFKCTTLYFYICRYPNVLAIKGLVSTSHCAIDPLHPFCPFPTLNMFFNRVLTTILNYLKIGKMILILILNKIVIYICKAYNFRKVYLKVFWNS